MFAVGSAGYIVQVCIIAGGKHQTTITASSETKLKMEGSANGKRYTCNKVLCGHGRVFFLDDDD
jgi:hypothetical protein